LGVNNIIIIILLLNRIDGKLFLKDEKPVPKLSILFIFNLILPLLITTNFEPKI